MSSINLDLDFQDYSPTGSAVGGQQHPEPQVRIPLAASDTATSFGQNIQGAKSVLNALQSVANLSKGQSSSAAGLSDEALQQLIWLSGKQKNKQQRGSIAAGSNWGLGYFAQYFDVTTEDVLQRIVWSAVPFRKSGIDLDGLSDSELTAPLASNMAASSSVIDENTFSTLSGDQQQATIDSDSILRRLGGERKRYSYMERFIQSRPDFYGPFWVSTTLIFAVAIFSNIVSFKKFRANMIQIDQLVDGSMAKNETKNLDTVEALGQLNAWHYSMDELNTTASLVMFYVTILPTFLWFLFWFRGCARYYTLTETICAYGYSLSIYIPLSGLLMVQATLFRYIITVAASLLSGIALMMSFLPVVRSDTSAKGSHIILVIVPLCHFGLAYILHRIMLQ